MDEGESTEWPDDDTDPFGDSEPEQKPSSATISNENLGTPEEESKEETEEESKEESEGELEESESNSEGLSETMDWKLPVRAAPLLQQFHNEEVTEYPLQQSADGRKPLRL